MLCKSQWPRDRGDRRPGPGPGEQCGTTCRAGRGSPCLLPWPWPRRVFRRPGRRSSPAGRPTRRVAPVGSARSSTSGGRGSEPLRRNHLTPGAGRRRLTASAVTSLRAVWMSRNSRRRPSAGRRADRRESPEDPAASRWPPPGRNERSRFRSVSARVPRRSASDRNAWASAAVCASRARPRCTSANNPGDQCHHQEDCGTDQQPPQPPVRPSLLLCLLLARLAALGQELTLELVQLAPVSSRPVKGDRQPRPAVELGEIPTACVPLLGCLRDVRADLPALDVLLEPAAQARPLADQRLVSDLYRAVRRGEQAILREPVQR